MVPPCWCCVTGVISIPVSLRLWPLDGWKFTFFTHWWPFPVATLGAPVSLLLCCWQTAVCKSHMDTANGTKGVTDKGFRRRLGKGVKVRTRADWKWLQKHWWSVFICSDMDCGVIFYHACGSLSPLIVCNKLPADLELQERSVPQKKYVKINLYFIFSWYTNRFWLNGDTPMGPVSHVRKSAE